MTNEKPIEQYEVETEQLTDGIESTYYELLRSHDYSNEEIYPTTRLEELGMTWMVQEDNPDRSVRSRNEANKITKLIAFEVAWRTGRVQTLIDFYRSKP